MPPPTGLEICIGFVSTKKPRLWRSGRQINDDRIARMKLPERQLSVEIQRDEKFGAGPTLRTCCHGQLFYRYPV
jgi:hypothetical protein